MHTSKSRWLLALCGILASSISGIYLVMYLTGPDGPVTFRGWNDLIWFLNRLALAGGACAITAGVLAKRTSWLLVVNGVALGACGLSPLVWRKLSLDYFAFLIVVMAMTVAMLALAIARRDFAGEWFFSLAGAGSISFAFAFLALVNRWIPLERRPFHPSVFLWICFYFAFSAVFMFGLAVRGSENARLAQ
ncbi:MAG TPA: hypothetical protein VKR43_06675 [Bryobacteraceae bacterium]|nr:hypothetical protein [Bryobacteraceae bacterium]